MCNFFRALALMTLGINSCAVYASDIADPTKPTGYRTSAVSVAESYQLESILIGRDRKIAIISGLSFREGDMHSLGKVIDINNDNVVVQGSKRHILKLVTQSVKKTVDKK